MRKILVTGGTVFVSRTLAEYFVAKGDDVYVLNRNNRPQSQGVTLIEANRYDLGDILSSYTFDVVIDANSYTAEEMTLLLESLSTVKEYVFISTSAVYPEIQPQPFKEIQPVGPNKYWGKYGSNKIAAEEILVKQVPQAYILRPAYIYGPYNNVYREAFVFDCARAKRPFYLPGSGQMRLQFIHMRDICEIIDQLLVTKPTQKIYNIGNEELISLKEWVTACYEVVGEKVTFVEVDTQVNPLNYFPFADYEYQLNVTRQMSILDETIDLKQGLKESWQWYQENEAEVNKRDYLGFIETELEKTK